MLHRQHHAFLDDFKIFQRDQAAEDRFLSNRQADTMAVLHGERGFPRLAQPNPIFIPTPGSFCAFDRVRL